jgi:NADP+-dependent farnesol dehydrogenase
MEKWKGKLAVVTGASAGIGAAIVRDFVKNGINVIALARRVEKLQALQSELKDEEGNVIPMCCDVSKKSSIDDAFDQIEQKFENIHILVNNAGIALNSGLLDDDDLKTEDAITSTINTNVLGLVRMTRRAYKIMSDSKEHGVIINIGSVVGHSTPFTPFVMNIYPASKHAVRAVTEQIRQELIHAKKFNIRVCVSEI